ncbi:MAG: DUF2127 domain-containing protein [Candidatus Staskawiczbacteria bacterium]|nr:DUF2127 domain-containing protein [Candidatus Staskawiczbacteria bacterium]
MKTSIKKIIEKIFEIGILIKSFFGFFEILTGIFIAVSGEMLIDNFLINMAMDEIARDPNDFIATHFIYMAVGIYSGAKIFAILYLIIHGVINISLAVALVKNKIWAYPWAIAGFGVFIIYQFYKYFHTHSMVLLVLTVFDIFFVFIIFLEYRRLNKK